MSRRKIVVTGAAGLVGQNLIPRLKNEGNSEIVAIDKHPQNVAILRQLHPELRVIEADLADAGAWQQELEGCTHLVIGQAQIGGIVPREYVRNNVTASERLVESALRYKVPYLVSISSSVVNSMAVDDYTETKKAQEKLVAACGIPQVVLRPTLMFGWFDRKHVSAGWRGSCRRYLCSRYRATESICASRCMPETSVRSSPLRLSVRLPPLTTSPARNGLTTLTLCGW